MSKFFNSRYVLAAILSSLSFLPTPSSAQVAKMTKKQIQTAAYNMAQVVCHARKGIAYYPNTTTSEENLDQALFRAGLNRKGVYNNSDWDAISANTDNLLASMTSNCVVHSEVAYVAPKQRITVNGIEVKCGPGISNCSQVALPAIKNYQKELRARWSYCQSLYRTSPDVNDCVRALSK